MRSFTGFQAEFKFSKRWFMETIPNLLLDWSDERMFAPYAERNKAPIFDVLNEVLPQNADVLEIASGTGQHCVHFAAQRPDWSWQPSEIDPERIKSINAHRGASQLPNLCSAITVEEEKTKC